MKQKSKAAANGVHRRAKNHRPGRPKNAGSVSARVQAALSADLHYAKSIELGIVNRSAIAQQLARRLQAPAQAVKVAVTRWAKSQAAQAAGTAERTRRVLSRSTIRLQDEVSVLVLENEPAVRRAMLYQQDERLLSVVASARSLTLIGPPEAVTAAAKKAGRHLKRLDGLCLLQLSSAEEIEDVPGVYAAVLDALARKGINVLESSSCFTDTNIVLKRKDAVRAFEALEEACGKRKA